MCSLDAPMAGTSKTLKWMRGLVPDSKRMDEYSPFADAVRRAFLEPISLVPLDDLGVSQCLWYVQMTLEMYPEDSLRAIQWGRELGAEEIERRTAVMQRDWFARHAQADTVFINDVDLAEPYLSMSSVGFWRASDSLLHLSKQLDRPEINLYQWTLNDWPMVPVSRLLPLALERSVDEALDSSTCRLFRCANCQCRCTDRRPPRWCLCRSAVYCSGECAAGHVDDHRCNEIVLRARNILRTMHTTSNRVCLLHVNNMLIPITLALALESVTFPILYPGLDSEDVRFLHTHQRLVHEAAMIAMAPYIAKGLDKTVAIPQVPKDTLLG